MNRRESIAGLAAGVIGSLGAKATADVVQADPKPLFVLIRTKRTLTSEVVEHLRKSWDRVRALNPDIPPCVVIGPELDIEVMREKA